MLIQIIFNVKRTSTNHSGEK